MVHSWDSSGSDRDYMVMAVKHKRFTELKVAGTLLPIRLNGKSTRVWIDSGSLISIFTIGSVGNKAGYPFGGGQCISGLWKQSTADD